ncbi:MAG: pyridoxamine 5'-phosphate oxidase family protein [Gammaproteobacteria bacterium]|nr:pyridoxamine 5'-phosphate oxidase family protein [Gammaproteobacteria bacterium]
MNSHNSATAVSSELNSEVNEDKNALAVKANSIIKNILYLTLATSDSNNNPWNSPVYCAFDKSLDFFWMSASESQHAINIRNNGKAFGVIYDSSVPHGQGFGVYFNGVAVEYNADNIDKIKQGIEILGDRIDAAKRPTPEDYLAPNPRRVYGLHAHSFWVNVFVKQDGKYIDKRIDITKELKQEYAGASNKLLKLS